MFSPRSIPNLKANCALFYVDRQSYTIDALSPIGWYVLFPKAAIATPELIYHNGSNRYYGYTTKPNNNTYAPLTNEEIRTGRCTISWLSIEEAINSQYSTEYSLGIAQDLLQFTGRIVSPKLDRVDRNHNNPIDPIVRDLRQVFGFYSQDRYYKPDLNPTPAIFNNSTKILAQSRHVPVSRSIPNSIFGAAVNLTLREITQQIAAIDPAIPMIAIDTNNTIASIDYNPAIVATVLIGIDRRLILDLNPIAPIPITLSIEMGATVFDSPIAIDPSKVNVVVRTTAIEVMVYPGVDRVELALPIALVGVYTPIVQYGHTTLAIAAWVV